MNNTLKFNEDKLFKILQFTDVHYDSTEPEDFETSALMRKLLDEENPDFVFLTGDISTGRENVRYLKDALAPITERNLPFALIFGNHDAEYGESHDKLLAELSSIPNCMTSNDTSAGFGKSNFVLPIQDEQGNHPWLLFGLDSNMYNENKLLKGYDYIRREQIEWYMSQHRLWKEKEGNLSSLVFFHIALPEYNDVWDYCSCYGEKQEAVCCPYQNSGMFSAMLEIGMTKGVFVGHDHVNDYWGELYGIRLCYGRATGYNTYGHEGFLRGARVIILHSDNTESFDTYVRLSDGTVITDPTKHEPEKIRAD